MSFVKRNAKRNHLSFPTREKHGFLCRHADIFLFFLFLTGFYLFLLCYIKPVDGINDDWGMYSMLSGAYLGEPDAHVLFFLYPLSRLLCAFYQINSSIPWYGLFQHAVHILCIWLLYHRTLQLRKKHFHSDSVIMPSLTILLVLFFIVDLNVISEVQYTTTAGFCASTALFYFITTKSDESLPTFLKGNIPTFILVWLAFSIRQNVLYMLLPMAGMLWISKWTLSNQRFYSDYILKLLSFAVILFLGMGILYGAHMTAYSGEEWSDFIKINHYRERVEDFYTWPEYEECSSKLTVLGINEETYYYRKNGVPYIGYQMSLSDWEQMHKIAKDCYFARTSLTSGLKYIAVGTVTTFLYQNGMQPLNLCTAVLFLFTFCCIIYHRNPVALAVYLLYLLGRMVTWGVLLFQGHFPKRIIQPLIAADVMVLFGILFAFNLIQISRQKFYMIFLPCIVVLSAVSVYCTKINIDSSYHANQAVWEDLKEYCYAHPDNFYIWTYDSSTLDNYCESPFDTTSDAYQNFFYTNWGVVCNPNSRKKLAKHGIENFGEDLVKNQNIYFIFKEGLYYSEHPVTMYFRHTYHASFELADTFTADGYTYEVYELR